MKEELRLYKKLRRILTDSDAPDLEIEDEDGNKYMWRLVSFTIREKLLLPRKVKRK